MAVIFLSLFTVQDDLLLLQSMHSLLKMLRSLVVCRITTILRLRTLVSLKKEASSDSNLSELSESRRTSARLYFLFYRLKSMLSTNLDALITRALLI